ncbi:MAG: histidinol dehydrogenase [Deltaproteobacteria bacterium]|nr:histidinol dehydrogenase [Deltaproteobacteria bacterium]
MQLQESVAAILKKVRDEGDAALRFYAKKFDNYEKPFRVSREEAAKAQEMLPPQVIEELDFAISQVTAFAMEQRACIKDSEKEYFPGFSMGHRVLPVGSCGCYVPAGRYPCLTSAVMAVIPAKVAGVKRIVVCSPPSRVGGINPGILYTLYKMEVEEIYCLGGPQAIGALAYGTETIKPVDMIAGPGNKYVQEAKRQVFGHCGIDFLAGPSEVLVLADDTARPDWVAADLLAQAEHDPNARAALVTNSESVAKGVLEEIEKQLKVLETEEVARASWEVKGEAVLCDTLDECIAWANEYSPEHLEIHCRQPREIMTKLENYGSLFLGELTAEVYADKISGTNHILPTGRCARYTGGLWVGMFLKVITHQSADLKASLKLAKYAEDQAIFEKMDAHRQAATIRISQLSR